MSNPVEDIRREMAEMADADPDMVLITYHLMGELPAEESRAFDERMRTDLPFRRRADRMIRLWSAPQRLGHTEEDDRWLEEINASQAVRRSAPTRRARSAMPSSWLLAASVGAIAVISGTSAVLLRVARATHGQTAPLVATSPAAPQHVASSTPRPTAPAHVGRATPGVRQPRTAAGHPAIATRTPDHDVASLKLPELGQVVVATARRDSVPAVQRTGSVGVNVSAVCDSARVRAFAAGPITRRDTASGGGLGSLLGTIAAPSRGAASESRVGGRVGSAIPSGAPNDGRVELWKTARMCDSLAAAVKKP